MRFISGVSSIYRLPSLLAFLTILLLSACADDPPAAPVAAAEPVLAVAPEFEQAYHTLGGRTILGTPVSEAFLLDGRGPLVQYFQTLRLEMNDNPDSQDNERVVVYPLGEWAVARQESVQPAAFWEDGPKRHFPHTGQTVRGAFLSFYEAHSGDQLLGPPISGLVDLDGRLVQFFRNGRLDWQPDQPPGQQVQLGRLGQEHFDAVVALPYRRAMVRQFVPEASVTSANVYIYVDHPVQYSGDTQVLHITVLTPEGRSVSGLDVVIYLTAGSSTESISLRLPEGQNQLHVPLEPAGISPGSQVELTVSVFGRQGNLLGENQLSYETWW